MTGEYFKEKFENSVGETVIGGPSFSLLFYNCKIFFTGGALYKPAEATGSF